MRILGMETSCGELILPGGRMKVGPPDPRLAPGQAHPPAPALTAVSPHVRTA